MRRVEAQAAGWPHIHCVILAPRRRFMIRPHWNKRGYIEYVFVRVHQFQRCWTIGFSKWNGVYDISGLKRYMMKHMVKRLHIDGISEDSDFDRTELEFALLWVNRVRAIEVMRIPQEVLSRLDTVKDTSNREEVEELLEKGYEFVCTLDCPVSLDKVTITDVREAHVEHGRGYKVRYRSGPPFDEPLEDDLQERLDVA
jgi:hypothetical protein